MKQRTLFVALLLGALFPGLSEAQNVMQLGTATTSPGSLASLAVFLTHDGDVQGFQTAATFDNAVLTLDAITIGSDLLALIAPDSVEFFLTTIDNNVSPGVGWGATAAICDSSPPFNGQTLPPGSLQSIANYGFSVVNDPVLIGTSTPVSLTNGLGPPPGINNLITVNATSIQPQLVGGQVEFVDLPSFIRGDINTDTVVNVADGVFLVQYLFNNGPTPLCFSAGDANDDSSLDISDFIYILQFQFLSGSTPPAPFPGCGVDPTGDGLSCEFVPTC